MVEWNEIFRLFRFSGILGQPREVHPKFRNEIPENVCSIRSPTRNFRNFWSNGKRPMCLLPRDWRSHDKNIRWNIVVWKDNKFHETIHSLFWFGPCILAYEFSIRHCCFFVIWLRFRGRSPIRCILKSSSWFWNSMFAKGSVGDGHCWFESGAWDTSATGTC